MLLCWLLIIRDCVLPGVVTISINKTEDEKKEVLLFSFSKQHMEKLANSMICQVYVRNLWQNLVDKGSCFVCLLGKWLTFRYGKKILF